MEPRKNIKNSYLKLVFSFLYKFLFNGGLISLEKVSKSFSSVINFDGTW